MVLSPNGQLGRLVWAGTSNGMFTVRSAYPFEKARILGEKGECSSAFQCSGIWKKLWKMRVPRVVKNFLWRVCNNLLPTKENICRKVIVNDPMCPICSAQLETIRHILWKCNSATAVWMECNWKIHKLSISKDEGMSLAENLMASLDEDDLALAGILARKIWLRRNSVVYGGDLMSPMQV